MSALPKFIFNTKTHGVGVFFSEADNWARCGAIIGPNPSFETVKMQLEAIEKALRNKDERFVAYGETPLFNKEAIPLP